ESYGAFVEITPGVEGLLHISEVEHNRIVKIEKVLNVGDKTKVQVIRVDENGHIGLSRKALIPNVWKDYIDSVEVEQIVKGTVDSINRAGIVINLNEQIQAFLPKSEFSWDRNVYLEDYVKEGDEMEAKIIELDLNKKRVILSKKRLSPNPWETLEIKPEDMLDCKVIKVLDDGIRFSTNGITGYLPSSNYGDRQGFKVGEEFKARVRLFDSEKDKLFVTLRAQRASSSTYTTSRKSSGADKEVNKYLKNQEEISNTFGDFINLDDYK
ncbi:MAG: S1 RNA-binding domain-containing protein, partial [Bacilli bacterium]